MKRPPVKGAGRDDVGSVPASVRDGQGGRPEVRKQLEQVRRYALQSAERGELTGAALAVLADLERLGVRSGGVAA